MTLNYFILKNDFIELPTGMTKINHIKKYINRKHINMHIYIPNLTLTLAILVKETEIYFIFHHAINQITRNIIINYILQRLLS